jgi:putative chitinase
MSPQLVAACTGSTLVLAEVYAGFLSAGMAFDNITTPMRQAMFLANVGHESLGLKKTVENLNYRSSALISQFGRHRISIADANRYGRSADGSRPANQEEIANCIYGGPWGRLNLGNTQPGDGWKFRGEGLLQYTGRGNARALRESLRKKYPLLDVPDFELHPEKIAEPQWAALSACDYVDMRSLNDYADAGNFDAYCDTINLGKRTDKYGDCEGWEDRLNRFNAAKVALRIA